jgi:hypothetical protein
MPRAKEARLDNSSKKERKNTMRKSSLLGPVAIVLATFCPSFAFAACGSGTDFKQIHAPDLDALVPPGVWNPAPDVPTIVGMWKAVFTSAGTPLVPGPIPLPAGVPFEYGYAQWHSDGTEFFNSGDRLPATQNVCLGVWQQIGHSRFKLNHFAYNYQQVGADPMHPDAFSLVGKVNIREDVVVDETGNRYSGHFTIEGWDMNGNQIINIVGTIKAVRVTVDTVDTAIP